MGSADEKVSQIKYDENEGARQFSGQFSFIRRICGSSAAAKFKFFDKKVNLP